MALLLLPITACLQDNTQKRCFAPEDCKSPTKRCVQGYCQEVSAPICGDFVVDADEACDDGNQSNNDACLNTCILATCGDGYLQHGVEECDKGSANSNSVGNACRLDCLLPTCGDGVVDDGESCDAGVDRTPTESDTCNADCSPVLCGDGKTNAAAGEDCDAGVDGTPADGAVCDEDCTTPACGDGHTNSLAGEECDDGSDDIATESATCDDDCTTPACGDGKTNTLAGEECDDGNTLTETCEYAQTSCEVCDANCQTVAGTTSLCGDGLLDNQYESCDEGEILAYDGWMPIPHCGTTCAPGPTCGDGEIHELEQCEPLNDVDTCGSGQSCFNCMCSCNDASAIFNHPNVLGPGTVYENKIYVADWVDSALAIYVQAEAKDMVYSESKSVQGLVKQVQVHENHIFLAEDDGFEVMQISGTESTFIETLHSQDISLDALSLDINASGNLVSALLLDIDNRNIHRMDVSEPLNPQETDSISYSGEEIPYGILAEEGILYVQTNQSFYVYPLNDDESLTIGSQLGSIANAKTFTPSGKVDLHRYSNNRIAAAIEDHGLRIYDITDSSDLCFTDPWTDENAVMTSSIVSQGYLYTNTGTNSMDIFSLNTTQPGVSENCSTPISLTPTNIDLSPAVFPPVLYGSIDNNLYTGFINMILTYNLEAPLAPTPSQTLYQHSDFLSLYSSVGNGFALLSTINSNEGRAKIIAYDIKNPITVEQIGEFESIANDPIANVDEFVFYQDYAIQKRLKYFIDLSAPETPVLNEINNAEITDSIPSKGIVVGHYLYTPRNQAKILSTNLQTPTLPVTEDIAISDGSESNAIAHLGNYLYVTTRQARIDLINISTPENPLFESSIDLSANVSELRSELIVIHENKVYIFDTHAGDSKGLYVASMLSATTLDTPAFYPMTFDVNQVEHNHTAMYLKSSASDLSAIEFANPETTLDIFSPMHTSTRSLMSVGLYGNQLYANYYDAGFLRFSLCP